MSHNDIEGPLLQYLPPRRINSQVITNDKYPLLQRSLGYVGLKKERSTYLGLCDWHEYDVAYHKYYYASLIIPA